jgi:hypothetical protein
LGARVEKTREGGDNMKRITFYSPDIAPRRYSEGEKMDEITKVEKIMVLRGGDVSVSFSDGSVQTYHGLPYCLETKKKGK